MIPAPFAYYRAASITEALDLLADNENARILAGGHSLVPAMKLRRLNPAALVDIARIPELSFIAERGDTIAIGARTRYIDLSRSPLVERYLPPIARAARLIGDTQVRRRGTIGGSLVHADPAADLPAIALTLDAELIVQSRAGQRRVPASQFFTGAHQTQCARDEIVVEIHFARRDIAGWSYQRMTRRSQDWPAVTVTAVRSDQGISVGLGNMADVPLRARAIEAAIASGATIAEASKLAYRNTQPRDDSKASAEYRRHLARVFASRALNQAL